ncbi:MAG: GNAT family N-acetyltransferase [Ktedonobacteraceae bacterium]
MIRPVLYVDLPGIIYSLDRRARSRQHEFANFVCWLEPLDNRLSLPPILRNIFPLNPASRTWIAEDHWHILGFAQVQERPLHTMWDISYLASMVQRIVRGQEERNVSGDEILMGLLEYMLEMAGTHGILRIFAKVEDEVPEQELFQRAGFQRYARELTYVYDPATVEDRDGRANAVPTSPSAFASTDNTATENLNLPSLRRWNRHYVWGLHQLYRSVTPQRVQMAELLENSEEFAKLHVGSLRSLPSSLSRGNENYVCDVGVRLGAWMRLSRGHGSAPHQLSLIVHPEHADLAEPLIRFGIQRLQEDGVRRIYCAVREYESFVITALRNSGFEHTSTRAMLVRHIALLAMRPRTVPLLEQRVVYGVKGLGTVNSRQTMR